MWIKREVRKDIGFGKTLEYYRHSNGKSAIIINQFNNEYSVFISTFRKKSAFVEFQREEQGTLQIIDRNFKKLNQAQNFAKKFMKENKEG